MMLSNEEVKKLRLQSRHHWHSAGNVLADTFSTKCAIMMGKTPASWRAWLSGMLTSCKAPKGSEHFHIDMLSGSLCDALSKT